MIEEKPIAAFTLSLLGLVFQALGAIFFTSMMFYGWGGGAWGPGMMMGPWMMMGGPWSVGFGLSYLAPVFSIIVITLGVLGVLWMNTGELSRVRTGSTLVLVTSIIAFPTMFGFLLGSLLMFVGGILGLAWQPVVTKGGGGA